MLAFAGDQTALTRYRDIVATIVILFATQSAWSKNLDSGPNSALDANANLGLTSALPLSRQVDWSTAGIPGDIPKAVAGANVIDFGAVANDNKDDWSAFQKAINEVKGKAKNAIIIPSGNFIISKTLKIDMQVVLRGAGAENTHLTFTMKGNGIEVTKKGYGPWIKLTHTVPFRESVLKLTSTRTFAAGDFVEIQQKNDKKLMYTSSKWDVPWAQQAVGQLFKVKKVSENTLVLTEPTNITFKRDLGAEVRRVDLVPWVGIEDLHITRQSTQQNSGFSIFLKNTAYTWISRVHSEQAVTNHIGAHRVYKCEIRDSYLHDSSHHGVGGNGYGVKLGFHVTGCLIENNIFHSLRHSMLLHLGANGNVLGYNYSYGSKNQTGKILPDISIHGHYPYANLIEANIVEEIGFADFWGPAGPLNTAYRNCVTKEGIWLQDQSSRQTIIGNTIAELPESYIGYRDGSIINGTLAFANEPAEKINLEQQPLPTLQLTTGNGIGSSLYATSKPNFYASMRWPSTGSGLAFPCVNPALRRQENRRQ